MNAQQIHPVLQLIAAGGLSKGPTTFEEAVAARLEIEAKVSTQVYAELSLMVGEKLRAAQHALIDTQHGHGLKANGSEEELSMRVDILRNLRDLYQKKASQ